MYRHFNWRFVIILICFMAVFTVNCFAEVIAQKDQQQDLKSACLSATITAINLEIDRYQQWIDLRKQQEDSKDLLELQVRLISLKADLEKYRNMDSSEYVLPEKVHLRACVQGKAVDNSALVAEGMSKSGPFYHLAGIVSANYAALLPNEYYEMTFYKVYPRSYWYMDSDYIYIAAFSSSNFH